MKFCQHVASLFPELKAGASGQQELPAVLPSALESFNAMESGEVGNSPPLWSFANLHDVFNYLRGGKSLSVPPEWRGVVPKAFPVASATM